jgi:sulfopyruvate decarboxylase TPP-binding subunit
MIDNLFEDLIKQGYNFFTGVPDSALKPLQNSILKSDFEHVVATNEGQAVGIAFGAEIAGKKACVYLQNSGLGNTINPLASLCMPFKINPLLIIGHRHTLEQHKIMGESDEKILQTIGYTNYIIIKGENNVK